MKLLVTAATLPEIQPLLHFLDQQGQRISSCQYHFGNCDIDILITGIGMMHTAYHLGRHLAVRKPHMAIQAGIGGTFKQHWELGGVVLIHKEYLADLGAEDHDQFKDLFDLQLWQLSQPPFTGNSLINTFAGVPYLPSLQQATGITVNRVSGSLPTIEHLKATYVPDIESMEGAAFHYTCLMEKIPFLQLRSISNYVAIRDKSKWKIPLAISMLNNELVKTVNSLAHIK